MKHWVFDLDGTLVDTARQYAEYIAVVLDESKVKYDDHTLQKAYNFFNPEEYFQKHFAHQIDAKLAVQKLIQINKDKAHEVTCFDGILELLHYLNQNEVKISIWTGREISTTKEILKCTGIEKYVHMLVSRSCVERNKPYPDGLLKILTESKEHGDDTLMIGDHEYDMQGARAAKVKAISVSWGPAPHQTASNLSDWHFHKVQDLHNWAQKNISK